MNYDGNSTLVDFATGDSTLLGVTLAELVAEVTHCDDVMAVTDADLDDDGPVTLPSATHDDGGLGGDGGLDDDEPATLPSASLVRADQTLPSMRWAEPDALEDEDGTCVFRLARRSSRPSCERLVTLIGHGE